MYYHTYLAPEAVKRRLKASGFMPIGLYNEYCDFSLRIYKRRGEIVEVQRHSARFPQVCFVEFDENVRPETKANMLKHLRLKEVSDSRAAV